jgi:hypothetical protein
VTFDPPVLYRRKIGQGDAGATLELSIGGLKERDGAWYLQTYRLLVDGIVVRDLGRADWADRSPNGDLLLAHDGRLLRMAAPTSPDGWRTAEARVVADLTPHRFEPRVAPASATRW